MADLAPELKTARHDEFAAVNAIYEEIQFAPSLPERDTVVIAKQGNNVVGLGRLIHFEGFDELGGMWVSESQRGQGIARRIVERLLDLSQAQTIYCIPFPHLSHFYESFGFRKSSERLPKEIEARLSYCQRLGCSFALVFSKSSSARLSGNPPA